MTLNPTLCERARLARDPRFDGLFFIGVHSTGIYCRPICPARSPKAENIVYYPTAAAAAEVGLRPCRRCRPESAPGSPAWNGTSAVVSRALVLIRQGALEGGRLEELAAKLGVGARHLRRLFQTHLGASPKALVTTERILFAQKLLRESDLPVTRIALAAGFGSIRRFNAAFRKRVGLTPTEFRRPRRGGRSATGSGFRCRLTLPYRPPYDWPSMLNFFASRAIPGVEAVAAGRYCRTIRLGRTRGTIAVAHADRENALVLSVDLTDGRDLLPLVERVRRIFDLDANMAAIHAVLGADARLKAAVAARPGLRLPGAWDPFETAVRAVVGQQVSVKGARTLIGRIVARTGAPYAGAASEGLERLFPSAEDLAGDHLEDIGMPAKRVATLRHLARSVAQGELALQVGGDLETFVTGLKRLPGIGDWTAQYIAMRALGEPDAFPASDLGLVKALADGDERPSPRQVANLAENWRPWRAYAAIHLWHS